MMVSPASYRLEHIKDNFTDLTLEKKKLEKEIEGLNREIEAGKKSRSIVRPARDTILRVKKLYLKEIEELIEIREKKI